MGEVIESFRFHYDYDYNFSRFSRQYTPCSNVIELYGGKMVAVVLSSTSYAVLTTNFFAIR